MDYLYRRGFASKSHSLTESFAEQVVLIHLEDFSKTPNETDSNYSDIFSIWDRIFGTYSGTVELSRLRYGLDGLVIARTEPAGILKAAISI